MTRRIVLVVGLTAVAALIYNGLADRPVYVTEQQTEAERHVPAYFLHDFVATTMDDAGRPAQSLAAARMLRYADDGSMELTEPRLTLYQDGEAPWQAAAAHGRLSADGERMQLGGGVRVSRAGDDRLELVTDELLLHPKAHYAETDAPLTLTHALGRIDAVGLRAYMKDERLVLLDQVRGNYVSPP